MISYSDSLEGITAMHLQGFFVGWLNAPSPETHLRILSSSSHMVVARDGERVVGFVTAISDGVLSAYVPLLEVLPSHQGQGIGGELMRRMLEKLNGLYMIDLACDPDKQEFYSQYGMTPMAAMGLRNYERQSG